MKNRYIFDGYNVLYQWDLLKPYASQSLESRRDHLIDLLIDYQDIEGVQVIVIFDGRSGGKTKGPDKKIKGVDVYFSSGTNTADAVIEKMVADHKDPSTITVVTSDRQVAQIVRGYGALCLRSQLMEVEFKNSLESLQNDLEWRELKQPRWRLEDRL
jgi:predicted RNA-binding protein with PIN domain